MDDLHRSEDIVADRYRIVRPLGRGGTSVTYEAEDLTNYRLVAIKVLSLRQMGDWKVLELFERESRILQQLNHPAIPKYLDYFYLDSQSDRRFYLVQELVSGRSLYELGQKGWKPTESSVKAIAEQVLEILDYLHRRVPPVIHRDIKPQNLIRQSDGRIFLVDFGAVQDVYRYTVSKGGTFVGTLGYMPPEQFRGETHCASDVYALGATLVYLLTGKSPDELPQKRLKIDFRSTTNLSPQFADWLDSLLEPAIEDRYQSARVALKNLRSPQTLQPIREIQQTRAVPTKKLKEVPQSDRIVAQRFVDGLTVEIFARPWNLSSSLSAIVTVILGIVLSLISLFFLISLLAASGTNSAFGLLFVTIIFLLPLWTVFFLMMQSVHALTGNNVRLNIDSKNFYIFVDGWLGASKYQGRTANLIRVTGNWKHPQFQDARGRLTQFSLVTGDRVYRFDAILSHREMQWLERELSSFI
ncbi:serine/threonine protein kinase [Geitlerinema sp. FC II]|nr:serine/threonine protein kinase [Geitlerinema sp. FC II]